MFDDTLKPLIVGFVFSLVHVLSPYAAAYEHRLGAKFHSLCGGFAAAYIFLELIPSIGDYHEVIGNRIYGFILVGFVAFYGLESLLTRSQEGATDINTEYATSIGMAALYNFLLALGIGNELPATVLTTVLFSVLISCHLLTTDLSVSEKPAQHYKVSGRLILVRYVLVGLAFAFLGGWSERVTDLIAAAVVGAVLYRVLRRELPEFRKVHYRSFVSGAFFFAALHLALE
ncbi:MAG: hypothetical protein AB8B91_18735 [Rubripirellula sp.]